MDKYNERLVNGKPGIKEYGFLALMIMVATAGLFLTFIKGWGIILLAVGIFLVYLAFQNLNLEFEYILVNGDIDISKIISQKDRKEVKSIKLGDITWMTLADSERVANDKKNKADIVVCDYTCREKSDSYYAIYSNEGGKETINILDLDEKCVDHMKFFLKRKHDL